MLANFLSFAKKYLAIAVCFSFFINLLVLTVPLYMLQVFDRVLTSRSSDTLLSLTVIAIIALVSLAILDAARAHVVARLGYWMDLQVSPTVIEGCLKNTLTNPGYTSVQGLRDVANVRNMLASSAATAVLDLPWFPVFLIVIFLLHPVLGGLAVLGSVVLFAVAIFGEWANKKNLAAVSEETQAQLHQAENAIRNADAFEAMGISSHWIARWVKTNATLLEAAARAGDRNTSILSTSRFFRMGLQLCVLGVGALLVLSNDLTPGAMIAASILISRALTPVEQSIASWKSLASAKKSYQQIKASISELSVDAQSMPLPRPSGALQVENLTYLHSGATEPCLYNIDFELAAGDSLGLIGPSGAGKSTLSRLLIGTLSPRLGHVRLDGMDITRWRSSDRGQYIGYLPQNVELMSGTVLDNISRMNTPNKDKVIAAAELANVHELIMRLPNGYQTQIGDQGALLSAGQRQRIALARAVYGEVSYVLLDEPNAHLDHEGELSLARTLGQLKALGITVIVVAHRPSILQQVDKLLVLKDGRITAFGPREEIINSVISPKTNQADGAQKRQEPD